MARRGTPHQPDDRNSGLVPYVQLAEVFDSPLLPYEKELIRLLGCTEDEYRKHVQNVRLNAKARPAEYALVPDIRCDPVITPILVNLAIGLALTAVSVLLQPKPRAPSASEQQKSRSGKSIRLASRQGSERFGATSGFDTISDLANYAEPIPVVFARRQDNIGGVLAAGQLVWSRAFSYGNEQGVKLLFIIGEQGIGSGIQRPDLEGIFLGTSPLDAMYAQKFAFYWNRNTDVNGRIKAKNFTYGTRARPEAGDPQQNDDIFLCPSQSATSDKAFSQSYTPSGNTAFGCYGAIANGTNLRLNFELVPLPDLGDVNSEKNNTERLSSSIRKRVKISGDFTAGTPQDYDTIVRLGQKGTGRDYGRRMGLRLLNGSSPAPGGPDGHKRRVSVKVGDNATFVITGFVMPENKYWSSLQNDVNVDDINNTTIGMREEADDMLQVGQVVMIARTVWVVTSRATSVWGAGVVGPFEARGEQSINLRCIDVFADGLPGNQVGFVSRDVTTRAIFTDDEGAGTYAYEGAQNKGLTVGPGYFPLMRVAFGIVRNTRPCAVTEVGLKSQVWNRANGLCNFGSLPTPSAMRQADANGDSLTSGTMNAYFDRSSVFTVWLRPAGRDSSNNEYRWRPLGEQFAVRGNRPVDQFNFLRFKHPNIGEYEFKFVPKNGADVTQFSPDDAEFWLLDARLADFKFQGAMLSRNYNTAYGTFSVQGAGRLILKGELEFAPEMATGVKDNGSSPPDVSAPSQVTISEYIPDIDDASAVATSVVQTGDEWASVPGGTRYRQTAFFAEVFGQATPFGARKTYQRRFELRENRWITLEFEGIVDSYFPITNPYFPGWREWSLRSIRVVGSSDRMNAGDVFNCRVPMSGGNPRNPMGYSSVGPEIKINTTSITAGPGGRENGYSFEVLGNASSFGVGTRRSAVIELSSGSKSTKVTYSAQVISAPSGIRSKFGVTNCYDYERVEPIAGTTSGSWATMEYSIDSYTVSSSNPYRDAGTTIGVRYQITATRQEKGVFNIGGDRIFEDNAGLTDLSNYQELEKSNASAPEHNIVYVSESLRPTDFVIDYDRLTSCGLALRSGGELSRIDQLRTWLYSGIEVKRFHPSEAGTVGPSNMLPDLVYHLMTDTTCGLGNFLSDSLLDLPSFTTACKFLKTQKLYFNGALTEPQNLREYITGVAPFFLLDFGVTNGKFSFTSAVPSTSAGAINTGVIPISALFTEGNILEGTFEVEFLEADQRRNFIAVMRWRDEQVNKLPEEKTIALRWNEAGSDSYPVESFDMTDYCCSEAHAKIAAKYLLSLRRRVTHTVSFKTTPLGLNLEPGQYIKCVTQANPYQAANNGVIEADGTLIMSKDLADNVYPIWYYNSTLTTTVSGSMTVINNKVKETALWNTIVTLRYPGISADIYQVQQLTLDEDGMVEIVALEHPTTVGEASQIALDLVTDSNFREGY